MFRYSFSLLCLVLLTLFVSSCAQTDVKGENISCKGAGVWLYLDESLNDKGEYRLYVNAQESQLQLLPEHTTNLCLQEGQNRIEIVHKRETADINMKLLPEKRYFLRLQKDNAGKLMLIETAGRKR